jgi:hypothetical protein
VCSGILLFLLVDDQFRISERVGDRLALDRLEPSLGATMRLLLVQALRITAFRA